MFIPLSTDAPVDSFPKAMIGLMIANVLFSIWYWTLPPGSDWVSLDDLDAETWAAFEHEGIDLELLQDELNFSSDEEGLTQSNFALIYGRGWTPLACITANFAHADLLHVTFNMIFLWVFGIIVEGKLGPIRFLLIYLGLGVFECAFEQALMMQIGVSQGGA